MKKRIALNKPSKTAMVTSPTYFPEPPDAFIQAVQLFNRQQFYQCHEVIEDELWRPEPNPDLKLFYQGILQIAVGYVHAQRNNPVGMNNLLTKGCEKLKILVERRQLPAWVAVPPLINTAEQHIAIAQTWQPTHNALAEIRYPTLKLTP